MASAAARRRSQRLGPARAGEERRRMGRCRSEDRVCLCASARRWRRQARRLGRRLVQCARGRRGSASPTVHTKRILEQSPTSSRLVTRTKESIMCASASAEKPKHAMKVIAYESGRTLGVGRKYEPNGIFLIILSKSIHGGTRKAVIYACIG